MKSIDSIFKFNKNDIIVIGCSTGPDSMALVDMLLGIRDKYNLSLIIAHVNHNIRKQSYVEAEYLKEYCSEHDLVFESMVIEKYGDDNFHNEARNIRYNFFNDVVCKYGANYLMTAHHGDDLMETILMRIVRGSNLSGYSGFKSVVDMGSYKIVRPLIYFTKSELKEYDELHGVKYYIDESNDKDKYTRNRYRKYVIPFLKSEDKDVHLKFLKFSRILESADGFINKERDKAIGRVIDNGKIIIDKFMEEDEFIEREILYYVLGKFYQDDLILVGDRHIDLILDLIKSRRVNGFVNLPNDVIGRREYNYFSLSRVVDGVSSYEIEFNNYVVLPNGHYIERISNTNSNSNNIIRLNSKDVTLPLIVRTRRFGDRISVKGLNGSKKIKNIFIDEKVPSTKRDSWPIVVDSLGRVVWIPGIKKSKFDKNKSDVYDIILKYD